MIRPQPSRGDVVTYDFRKPSRISPERQRSLEASHEQLAQQLQRWVSGRLRAPFEVHLESISQAVYGDFVDNLADPGATFLYDIGGQSGQSMAINLDASIAFLLVERLVGGSTVSAPPDRALTGLEQVVTRLVTDRVAEEYAQVWADYTQLNFAFSRFESARELVEMAGRDDDVLVTSLRAQFDEVTGYILLALPFGVLEEFLSPSPRRQRSSNKRSPAEEAVEKHNVAGFVRRAGVVVSAQLPAMRMSLGELARLKPGDVLPTEVAAEDPIHVCVSNNPRFEGRQGKLGPNLGVQITQALRVD
ncbi:MAG: FliM/FliN family flagellar motor switch protein [Gemmatimonadota bacterium]